MCPEVMPECPVCPADQDCVISNPSDCTECPQAYCAAVAPDATPTPTGIRPTSSVSGLLPSPISSSIPSQSPTGLLPSPISSSIPGESGSMSLPTGTTASITTTATETSSTGGGGSATASAPGASSSAPSGSSAAGRNADVAGVLGVALLMAVPVLGLQQLW